MTLPCSRQSVPGFSVSDTSLQPTPLDSRISLQVSKAITGFARYPHKRPEGLHSDFDGSLDIDEVWRLWGRFHGVTKHHMLQFIAEHAFSSAGHRRFLLRSDHEGRTWVSVTRSLRRFSKRRHHRDRRVAPLVRETLRMTPSRSLLAAPRRLLRLGIRQR